MQFRSISKLSSPQLINKNLLIYIHTRLCYVVGPLSIALLFVAIVQINHTVYRSVQYRASIADILGMASSGLI